jgi:hypothetical protein
LLEKSTRFQLHRRAIASVRCELAGQTTSCIQRLHYALGKVGAAMRLWAPQRPRAACSRKRTYPFRAVIAPQRTRSPLLIPGLGSRAKEMPSLRAAGMHNVRKPRRLTYAISLLARQVQLRIFGQGPWHLSLKYRFSPLLNAAKGDKEQLFVIPTGEGTPLLRSVQGLTQV